MAKLISFEEALRGTIKEGDRVIINALYPDESEVVKIYPDETGYKEEQLFSREEDLKFFYAKNKEGIPTFWGDATKKEIYFYGRTGAIFGITSVNKACKPWTNLEMGLYSRASTADDYNYLRDNLIGYRYILFEPAWLGSQYVDTDDGYVYFGLRNVYDDGSMDWSYLFTSDNGGYSGGNYVRPAVSVYLPSKIMVDMEKSKNAWVLVPNN